MTDLGPIDMAFTHDHEAKVKIYSIDIETFTQGKRANEYTDNKTYKLGNVKDPDKIEAALAKKKEEARRTHALHWWTGKIISIALVDVLGDEPEVCFSGHDEKLLLHELAMYLNKPCKLIGKSSEMFDFRFIIGRYMALDVEIPRVFKQNSKLFDVDKFFGYSAQSSQRGSLAVYAHGLGLDGKTMSGSDVHGLYERIMMTEPVDKIAGAKLWDELVEYNLQDARIVAEMARRYIGNDGRLI